MGEDVFYTLANGRFDFGGQVRYIDHRNVNSGNTRFVFRLYYRIIANANILINGIDGAEGPQTDKDIIKGQALVYRAWAHFQLVQLWGPRFAAGAPNSDLGVTLALESNLEPKPRSTVAEVYAQINKDLDEAIVLLANYTRTAADLATTKSYLNKAVAHGVKARVALAQQNWDAAATNAVEAAKGSSLMTNAQYQAGFNDASNTEWIWGSHQITDHNTFFWSYFANMSCNFNGTNTRTNPKAINANLWNALPDTDIRKKMWSLTGAGVPIPPGGVRIPYQSQKFLAASSSLSTGDIPYMRTGEMLLVQAEANARAGRFTAAQDALFTLLKNRNPRYVKSTNTGQALIDEIMLHRRIELWGEGFRFTDLKRLNQALNRKDIPNTNATLNFIDEIAPGDKLWQWLFPQDEINTNPLLEQNPL